MINCGMEPIFPIKILILIIIEAMIVLSDTQKNTIEESYGVRYASDCEG